jgi:hypothetical protein
LFQVGRGNRYAKKKKLRPLVDDARQEMGLQKGWANCENPVWSFMAILNGQPVNPPQ